MRRSTLVFVLLVATFGCARRNGPAPESASANPTVGEREGAGLDADACSHYLADAPPPIEQGEFMPVSEETMRAAMASIDPAAMPRCAHYEFAHVLMVVALFDDPRISRALWEHEYSMLLI